MKCIIWKKFTFWECWKIWIWILLTKLHKLWVSDVTSCKAKTLETLRVYLQTGLKVYRYQFISVPTILHNILDLLLEISLWKCRSQRVVLWSVPWVFFFLDYLFKKKKTYVKSGVPSSTFLKETVEFWKSLKLETKQSWRNTCKWLDILIPAALWS